MAEDAGIRTAVAVDVPEQGDVAGLAEAQAELGEAAVMIRVAEEATGAEDAGVGTTVAVDVPEQGKVGRRSQSEGNRHGGPTALAAGVAQEEVAAVNAGIGVVPHLPQPAQDHVALAGERRPWGCPAQQQAPGVGERRALRLLEAERDRRDTPPVASQRWPARSGRPSRPGWQSRARRGRLAALDHAQNLLKAMDLLNESKVGRSAASSRDTRSTHRSKRGAASSSTSSCGKILDPSAAGRARRPAGVVRPGRR